MQLKIQCSKCLTFLFCWQIGIQSWRFPDGAIRQLGWDEVVRSPEPFQFTCTPCRLVRQ